MMKPEFINLTKASIYQEHICCAFSDKKCAQGYQMKKDWLVAELDDGYVFRKLNERAKVFIEYGFAEKAWLPVEAPNYLLINCFWVSGQYKGNGYATQLLKYAWDDALAKGKNGLATVVGTKKSHYMSDTKWLLRQGFEDVERTSSGFSLLVKKIKPSMESPSFKACVLSGECECKEGLVAYYSNRCPFTEYHVRTSLTETAKKRNLPLKIIKQQTREQAQSAPSPATIFSLFYNGEFVTTDVSVCMDTRFDKLVKTK